MGAKIKLSETELIALLYSKDEKGFNYLYDNYAGAIYGLITKIVPAKEHADELIQDVFLKIWNNITNFDATKGRLYTWMINLARNTCIDYLRSKSYQNEQKNQSLPDFVSDSEHFSVSNQVDHIGVKNILSQLKEEWRTLIDLAYYQGYTQQEIADRLDIPIGTVKTRTRNALIELKSLLKEHQ